MQKKYKFIMPSQNANVGVLVVRKKYNVQIVGDNGVQDIEVDGLRNSITSAEILFDEDVPVYHQANEGYVFDSWSSDVDDVDFTGDTFRVPASDIVVTANYTKISYNVSVNGGTSDLASATIGDVVSLTAAPSEGYEFSAWACDDDRVVFDGNSFEMPADDVTIVAEYQPINYSISFDGPNGLERAQNSDGEIVETGNVGEEITISSFPYIGYSFSAWQSDDVAIQNNSFIMPAKNISISGVYSLSSYTVTSQQMEGGEVTIYKLDSSKDIVNQGSSISASPGTLILIAAEVTSPNHEFYYWSISNENVDLNVPTSDFLNISGNSWEGFEIEDLRYFYMPSEDSTVTANFRLKEGVPAWAQSSENKNLNEGVDSFDVSTSLVVGNDITYSLDNEPSGFSVDAVSGTISFTSSPGSFSFDLVASNSFGSATLSVNLFVADVDVSTPQWTGGNKTIELNEQNIEAYQSIEILYQNSIHQPDSHQSLTYSINSVTPSTGQSKFSINQKGKLYLVESIDYENSDEQQFVLEISATNDFGPSSFELTINVQDVFDVPPKWDRSYFYIPDAFSSTSTSMGHTLMTPNTTDNPTIDTGDAPVTYSKNASAFSSDSGLFSVDLMSGELSLAQSFTFDPEGTNTKYVQIDASSAAGTDSIVVNVRFSE